MELGKFGLPLITSRLSKTVEGSVESDDQLEDPDPAVGVSSAVSVSKDGSAAKYKVRFDEMGDLISDTGDQLGTGSNVIGNYFVVKNGTDGLEGAKLGDALYAGGVGSVKWDGNNMVLGVNTSHTEALEGDALKLRYEPKLFGIRKENGDYE